jgi:hypothetical protein
VISIMAIVTIAALMAGVIALVQGIAWLGAAGPAWRYRAGMVLAPAGLGLAALAVLRLLTN